MRLRNPLLKRLLSSLAVVLFLAGTAPAQEQQPRIFLPLVATEKGYGSAIVVQNNAALTAGHVVQRQNKAILTWRGQSWYVSVWARGQGDDAQDWAVLVSVVPLNHVPISTLASCGDTILRGEPVTSGGLQHVPSTGKVITIRDGIIYHTATIIPGDSGGPVWNAERKVIGMNIAYIGSWSMAIHFKVLLSALGRPCKTDVGERIYLTNPDRLVRAIRYAEGVPSYGNMLLARRHGGHTRVPEKLGRAATARIIHSTYRSWVKAHRPGPFIDYLGRRYAPIGVSNDPKGLNRYWVGNVSTYLRGGQ